MRLQREYISRRTLVRIFNMFQKQPNRVFIKKDFSHFINSISIVIYLQTLNSMKIIKECDVVYLSGKNSRGNTKGFKIR